MTAIKDELRQWDSVYHDVMALYAAIKDSKLIRVKRAEMKQGEVAAEPIDFCADVELKADRTLGLGHVLWSGVIDNPERYLHLPEHLRQELGRAFSINRLGVDGDYRALFFKLKNQNMRAALKQETE